MESLSHPRVGWGLVNIWRKLLKETTMIGSLAEFISRLVLCILAISHLFGTARTPEAVASDPVIDITFQSSAPYYTPQEAVVPMGIPIRWVNATASFHSVRHDACIDEEPCPFQSIAIPPDSSFVIAPLPPGRYSYHCELHPIMRGNLLVLDPSSKEARHDR
jgi:plastocyanin